MCDGFGLLFVVLFYGFVVWLFVVGFEFGVTTFSLGFDLLLVSWLGCFGCFCLGWMFCCFVFWCVVAGGGVVGLICCELDWFELGVCCVGCFYCLVCLLICVWVDCSLNGCRCLGLGFVVFFGLFVLKDCIRYVCWVFVLCLCYFLGFLFVVLCFDALWVWWFVGC